jgi:hypothetical protein
MAYKTPQQIENDIANLARRFANVCTRFKLANSVENRTLHGLRIAGPPKDGRPIVLITAGVHAREWAPPDALLHFLDLLLTAYKAKTPITEPGFVYKNRLNAKLKPIRVKYGKYVVPFANVQSMVEDLITYFIPMVNPDGRDFSLNQVPLWRKNRRSSGDWQIVRVLGNGGTYTLTVNNATTNPIAFDANSAVITNALSALATVGANNVEVQQPYVPTTAPFTASDPLCNFVLFKGALGKPFPPITAATQAGAGGKTCTVTVLSGDGVDINRNFDIAWKKELYYSVAAEKKVQTSATLDEVDAVNTYRGPIPMSEPEATNVSNTFIGKSVEFYLDLHAHAGEILYPWGMIKDQSVTSNDWFGNRKLDRNLPAQPGRNDPPYQEWFPAALLKQHLTLGGSMKSEIHRAVGPANVPYSPYPVKESSGLYYTTGAVDDYCASLQYLPDNQNGAEQFAFTFEAGDRVYDGGFFPDQTTGQFEKVERDCHAALVGFLIGIVNMTAGGPLVPPAPAKH